MREGAAGGSGEGAGREGGGGWHGSSLPLSSLCVTGTIFRGFRINERIEASGERSPSLYVRASPHIEGPKRGIFWAHRGASSSSSSSSVFFTATATFFHFRLHFRYPHRCSYGPYPAPTRGSQLRRIFSLLTCADRRLLVGHLGLHSDAPHHRKLIGSCSSHMR